MSQSTANQKSIPQFSKITIAALSLCLVSISLCLSSCISRGQWDPPREPVVYNIPGDFPTIQEAIDNAWNGDTLVVKPGRYYENLNFKGKNIILTSRFLLDNDPDLIHKTIIDGSRSKNPDRQSCVVFDSNEDRRAVLQGFTITGGKGTVAYWESDGAYFNGGAGIDINHSSPTIRYNRIIQNGFIGKRLNGGGIGIHDRSEPLVYGNLIAGNEGSFGAGISIWGECSGEIQGNVIAYNKGGHMYGGAGIALDTSKPLIINNTIVNNESTGNGAMLNGAGGAIAIWSSRPKPGEELLTLKNNIFWGNTQEHGTAIAYSNQRVQIDLTFCVVEGGFDGEGNLSVDPEFKDNRFQLSENSPAKTGGSEGTRMGAYSGEDTDLLLAVFSYTTE